MNSEAEVAAGASRFVTAFEKFGKDEKLVLFSGDLFSPSHLSTHLKGEQMVEVFNSLNVQVACLGNHDLDFGIAKMKDLVSKTLPCNWLMSNINVDGQPIGGLQTYDVREFQLAHATAASGAEAKVKIGFFGLASADWPGLMMTSITEEL